MNSYLDDTALLREQFAQVDFTDIGSIQKWFADHPYLTTNDHAQIANRSTLWIRQQKRKAGIKSRTPPVLPVAKPIKKPLIDVPPDWDTKEWLEWASTRYTIRRIALSTGKSMRTIYSRYKKWGLKPTYVSKSQNPCCTEEWVREHYVNQRLSQKECAKLAGICTQAFANWLNRFKIAVRTREGNGDNRDVSIWRRQLVHKLNEQEIVRRVFVRDDHIHVRFRNYYWESYFFGDNIGKHSIPRSYIINETTPLNHVPIIMSEYASSMNNEGHPAHIAISPKEWKHANMLERRIALHHFTWIINRRGYLHPSYPQGVIKSEFEKLVNSPASIYLTKNVFQAHPRRGNKSTYGFRIVMHYFGLDDMAKDLTSPRLVMKALNIASEKYRRINFEILARIMCSYERTRKIRVYDPGIYRWIFQHLGINGTVLDLNPSNGHRAIACAAAGLKYTTVVTPKFQNAIDSGFLEFLGLDFEPYTGQKVDCILNDADFDHTPITPALELAGKTRRILQFVRHHKRAAFVKKFPQATSLRLKTRILQSTPDYLFIL